MSEGRPPPEVTWKMALNSVRGLIPVEKSLEHQYEVLYDNSLHVKQVTFSDEGKYICISKSPGLLVNRSASLTVFGKCISLFVFLVGEILKSPP